MQKQADRYAELQSEGESAEPGIKESVGCVCVCARTRARVCGRGEVGKELKSGGQVVTENQKTG